MSKITFRRSIEIMSVNGEVTDIMVDGKPIEDNAEYDLLYPWACDQAEAEEARKRHNRIAVEIVGFARSMALVQAEPWKRQMDKDGSAGNV